MTTPTPDFLKNHELNVHERRLVKCAQAGEDCQLFDEGKASARFAELHQAEAAKPAAERRDDATLWNLAVREQAEAEGAPRIRAALIRFLARGGNADYPVDPYGVRLRGARIADTLTLQGCGGLRTLGLTACDFDKPPILLDAAGGTINLAGSRLPELHADRLKTSGSVFLSDGFEAAGAVRLSGAEIGSVLSCIGGRFLGGEAGGTALLADGLKTSGDVFLSDGFEAAGAVRLLGAEIGGDLACTGGRFAGEGMALHLQAATVANGFLWRGLAAPPAGLVDLTSAKVGTLVDDVDSWPKGKVILDGFRYDRIVGPTGFATRRDWLARQVPNHLGRDFRPQSFEQLAKVLRETGHTEDAKRIAILKLRKQRWANLVQNPANPIQWVRFLLSLFFETVVGFGYRPFRALVFALGFIVIGYFVFDAAYEARAMVPNNPSLLKNDWGYALAGKVRGNSTECDIPYGCFKNAVPDFQPFDPLVYSIDTFVPLVKLYQETHWIPQPEGNDSAWRWTRLYLWVHISVGWIITALFAASLTGLVKKDV